MKRVLLLAWGAAGLLAAGCAPSTGPDVNAAYAELSARAEAYQDALSRLDVAAFADFYAPEAVMYPPNHAMVAGRAAIQAYAAEVFATPGLAIEVETTPVHMGAAADIGYSTGKATVTMTGPDGTPVSDTGPDVHIWRRQPAGTWEIVIDIWNSTNPLPEPGAGAEGGR